MRIAMFGGSFNPVHSGHLELAAAVHEQAGYDRIIFVPAYHSPFKNLPEGATDEDRLNMLHLALDGIEWAGIDECEIKRGGVSYTYDTLVFLEEKYSSLGLLDGRLGLIMGADLAGSFDRWYRAADVAAKADIILARRCSADGSRVDPEISYTYRLLKNPYRDVSSSEVRGCGSDRNKLAGLVPEKVCDYIFDRGLYGTGIR